MGFDLPLTEPLKLRGVACSANEREARGVEASCGQSEAFGATESRRAKSPGQDNNNWYELRAH